jgi:CRISPR-associated protein Cas6
LIEAGIRAHAHIPLRKTSRSVQGGMGSKGSLEIRRTLQIRDKTIVGFALEVGGLSIADSIRLQELGLGGRHRFGCGVFVPSGMEAR